MSTTALITRVLDALRTELQQYGEMLALLEQQQQAVVRHAADDVVASIAALEAQAGRVGEARRERETCQSELASALGAANAFATLIPALPEKFRGAVQVLVNENNQLLQRVQRRTRQNHFLLTRSLQMMQRLMQTLVPTAAPATYNDACATNQGFSSAAYEAVG